MFSRMLAAAKLWLADRDPKEIAEKAKVSFDGKAFSLETMGKAVTVSYPDCQITPELSPWHQLLVLHYLHLADGTPLTGKFQPFAMQKEGMIRGGGFDREAETALAQIPFAHLRDRCQSLGGKSYSSSADYSVVLPVLPMYPVVLNYWQADEEFPASGRLLLDTGAEHYLTVEDSVTVGQLLLEELR